MNPLQPNTGNLSETPKRKHWGGPNALAARVAHALGTSQRAAESLLWGPLNIANRCARVVRALREAHADDVLVRFLAPIDEAIHGLPPCTVTTQLLLEEQDADGREDCAQTAFLAAPSEETARLYLRSLDVDLAARAKLRAAIAAKYGL